MGLDLFGNLGELLRIDHDLGVTMLPRVRTSPGPAAAAGARRQQAPAPSPAPQSTPDTLPPLDDHHLADLADAPAATQLTDIAQRIAHCSRCQLCQTRRHTVPGEGASDAALLFVGEGPGADEDTSGRPFVGAAGQLLDRMITAMGLRREDVYIANVIKCRPPGNRTPEISEIVACLPYLHRQILALRPRVICTLGNIPLRALTGDLRRGITRARGTVFTWQGIPCLPTFHPSYLLRNEAAKKPAWEDLQAVMAMLG